MAAFNLVSNRGTQLGGPNVIIFIMGPKIPGGAPGCGAFDSFSQGVNQTRTATCVGFTVYMTKTWQLVFCHPKNAQISPEQKILDMESWSSFHVCYISSHVQSSHHGTLDITCMSTIKLMYFKPLSLLVLFVFCHPLFVNAESILYWTEGNS